MQIPRGDSLFLDLIAFLITVFLFRYPLSLIYPSSNLKCFSFRSSFVLERRKLDPNFTLNGKSKSLDDLLPPSEAAKKSKNISMLEMGRANTYDDQVTMTCRNLIFLNKLIYCFMTDMQFKDSWTFSPNNY